MLFDGAFHVPSWALEGPEEERPARLIRHCQIEEAAPYGSEPSEAVHALATWLVNNPDRAKREADRPGSPLTMGGVMTRLIAGTILPSEQLAESIGAMTGGAVTFDKFEHPARAKIPVFPAGTPWSDTSPGALAKDWAAPERQLARGAREAQPGVLGVTPSGPLFTAERGVDGIINVRGLGATLHLDRVAAEFLKTKLEAALGAAA